MKYFGFDPLPPQFFHFVCDANVKEKGSHAAQTLIWIDELLSNFCDSKNQLTILLKKETAILDSCRIKFALLVDACKFSIFDFTAIKKTSTLQKSMFFYGGSTKEIPKKKMDFRRTYVYC